MSAKPLLPITMADYWMGRDRSHSLELSVATRDNAFRTVDLANKLIGHLLKGGIVFNEHPNGTLVASGWRPASINSATPGAAKNSLHMTGLAIDIYDPQGHIDNWLLQNPQPLIDIGLWQEHPSSTPTWCHVQTLPPRSGNRVFYP